MSDSSPRPSRVVRLKNFYNQISQAVMSRFQREPEDKDDVKKMIAKAHRRGLLDSDALSMIEGVLSVSELKASDIMIPSTRMDMVESTTRLEELLPFIISTAHSRFPLYDGNKDNIIGVLLAKDLLRGVVDQELNLHELARPALFIPETKRLDALLREFRSNRNHIAIVIDEHGSTAGLITIEDVLEQIVGDIEDEYDSPDVEQVIIPNGSKRWRVLATATLEEFNEYFALNLSDEEFDTIGGWIAGDLGRIPRRGDRIDLDNYRIDVVSADARRALWLRVVERAPVL